MAIQLGLSAFRHHALGVRGGGDRRQCERRTQPRGTPDRRRTERRRARWRSLLFSALTVAFPGQADPRAPRLQLPAPPVNAVRQARVRVFHDSFVVLSPRLAYDALIGEAARRYRLDAALIRSVMQAESGFNRLAVSTAGALGLMQLMPALASELGVKDPFDPRENIMAGARHLRRLLDLHDGDVRLAVASYNAGEGAVARYGAVPPFPETQMYVTRVTHLLAATSRISLR